MLKLTEIKIQESPELRGVNQNKGITSADMTSARVTLEQPVHDKVHELMNEALGYIVNQVADFATSNGTDGEKVAEAMRANILKFKLDAGGGYTDVHKASLIALGTDSGVKVEAIDFVAPKARGGAAKSEGSTAVTGDLEL